MMGRLIHSFQLYGHRINRAAYGDTETDEHDISLEGFEGCAIGDGEWLIVRDELAGNI